MATIVDDVNLLDQATEKLQGFWDDTGSDMNIAIKGNGKIAISSGQLLRVSYLTPRMEKTPAELWQVLHQVSEEIGRTLVKSQQGPYVFIPKLGKHDTRRIFRKLKRALHADVIRKLEESWDVEDAVLEEVV